MPKVIESYEARKLALEAFNNDNPQETRPRPKISKLRDIWSISFTFGSPSPRESEYRVGSLTGLVNKIYSF